MIGLLWVRHHGFFRELVRIDSRLIWLNIVYLGLVAFLPFPTELIGDNVEEPVVGRAAADPPGARLCGGIARRSGIL